MLQFVTCCDALKVQIAFIAWIMVVLFVALVVWVACSSSFFVGYQVLFGSCRLSLVARFVVIGLCDTYMLFVLGFLKAMLYFVGICYLWVFCLYVFGWFWL